jgi:hypothetical protein
VHQLAFDPRGLERTEDLSDQQGRIARFPRTALKATTFMIYTSRQC